MVEISHIHVSGDSHRNAPGQELEQDSIIQRKESNGRKRKPSESGALSSEPLDKRPRVESFTVSSSNQIDKVGLSQHTFDEDDLYDIFGSEPDNDPTMVHHNPTYPSPSPSTPQSLEKRTSARPPLTTHLPIPFQTSIPTPDSDPILNKHHSDAFHTAQTLIDWYKKRALETEIRHQEEQRLSHLRIASLENSLKNSQAAEITSSARIRELEEQLKVTRACVLTTSTPSQNEVELRKQVDYYEIEVEYLGTKAESRRKERDDLVIQLKGLRHDFEVLRQKRVVTQLPDKEETPSPTYQLEECKKEVRKLSGGNEEIGDFSRQVNQELIRPRRSNSEEVKRLDYEEIIVESQRLNRQIKPSSFSNTTRKDFHDLENGESQRGLSIEMEKEKPQLINRLNSNNSQTIHVIKPFEEQTPELVPRSHQRIPRWVPKSEEEDHQAVASPHGDAPRHDRMRAWLGQWKDHNAQRRMG